MAETLTEAGRIANRTQLETTLRIWSAQHLKENIAIMHDLVDKIIVDRKARPQPNRHDLLNVMLNEADPVTGEKLSDENIRYNVCISGNLGGTGLIFHAARHVSRRWS